MKIQNILFTILLLYCLSCLMVFVPQAEDDWSIGESHIIWSK